MVSMRARAESAAREVLAVYYSWYGHPGTTGHWVHWKNVDPANDRIENSAHFPAFGAYDSHDPAIVERQMAMARGAAITGFISSWWGPGSFEDQGMPVLLEAAEKHGLAISAYYEEIAGSDAASRKTAAIADLDYLLKRYATHQAWLHDAGRPVVFVYVRALRELSPVDWGEVADQVRHHNPGGVVLVADSLDTKYVTAFDGASTYNITGQTHHKSPPQIREWAHAAYPRAVAAAGPGKISSVTVIPGYDDTKLGRPPPRPVTERWGGETYRALWQEAVAAAPDYVLITSWNEWHEGSEIGPSVEYGSVMLNDTAGFAREFVAGRK
jgi:hypothetical protein